MRELRPRPDKHLADPPWQADYVALELPDSLSHSHLEDHSPLREVSIGCRSPYPECRSTLPHRFTGRGQSAELLLPIRVELM